MGATESQCCTLISAGSEAVHIRKGGRYGETSSSPISKAALTMLPNRAGIRTGLGNGIDLNLSRSFTSERGPIPKEFPLPLPQAEIQMLRSFIREHYSSAGDAFDQLFDRKPKAAGPNDGIDVLLKRQMVDQQLFEKCCVAAGFSGNARLIFELLTDTDVLTRACFKFHFEGLWDGTETTLTHLSSIGRGEPPKKLNQHNSGSGRSGRSYQDECQSLASGSTADTMLQSTGLESASTRDCSPPSELPQGSPRKLRKLDMMRPPPIQLPPTPVNTKRVCKIEPAMTQPKTPAHPKTAFFKNRSTHLKKSSPRRYSEEVKLTYP